MEPHTISLELEKPSLPARVCTCLHAQPGSAGPALSHSRDQVSHHLSCPRRPLRNPHVLVCAGEGSMQWALLSFCLLINQEGSDPGPWLAVGTAPKDPRAAPPLALLSEVRVPPLSSLLLECASGVHGGHGLIKSQRSGIES